jgi:hypothetical protein
MGWQTIAPIFWPHMSRVLNRATLSANSRWTKWLQGVRGPLTRDPLIRRLSGNPTSNDFNQYTQPQSSVGNARATKQRLRTKMARHLCFTRMEMFVVKEDAAHESASACEKWYQGSSNPSA